MASSRRKVLEEFSDEDNGKPRRSSLQVNLSYMSNVTDSGCGSFRKTDENTTEPRDSKICSLRGKRKFDLPSEEKEPSKKKERQLPRIISIESNFNSKDKALNESCSLLRDAILRKTREIFDQGNELAIKTSQVMQEGSKMIKSVEEEFSKSVILDKDSRSVILENEIVAEKISRQPIKSLKSMILDMSINTRSNLLEKMKESKLIPETNEAPKSITGKISTPLGSPSVRIALREDQQIIMSGKNKNADPVRINVMNSPKKSDLELATPKKPRISEISDRQSFPKKRLFTDENDPENCASENESLNRLTSPVLSGSSKKRSKFSLKRNENSSIGFPLTCSSFIDNRNQNKNSDSEKDLNCDKENLIKQVEESFKVSQDKRVLSMELTDVKGKIFDPSPVENIELVPGDFLEEDVSVKTTRTSLNVNVSMDETQENTNRKTDRPSNSSETQESKQTKRSTSTIRSSLQVNTSLDCLPNTRRRKLKLNRVSTKSISKIVDNIENSEGKNFIKEESILQNSNHIKRIKSNTIRKQSIKNNPEKINPVIMENCEELSPESTENLSLMDRLKSLFIKPSSSKNSRNSKSMNSTIGIGETSHIEGTPLPVSRSFLWKSQIKQNTFASNLNFNCSEESERDLEKSTEEKKQLKASSSSQSLDKTTTESNKSSKPEDSSIDVSKKPRKRKLYTARDRSQLLSLSPAKSVTPSPKRVEFPRRRRNKKWLKLRKTQEAEKIKLTQKEQSDEELSESKEDEPLNDSIRKSTKPKKPRKVLRKKIVIKKIANSDVNETKKDEVKFLNVDNSEDPRSSLNDFEPKKKDKNKNIAKRIIVTTGFTNEDKNMIKSVVKTLGRAEIEVNVSRKTTHVVNTGVRTINLLKGILRGCWLVSLEWVLNSLENGDWLSPEPYEMAHFSAAVQVNRRERQIFGKAFMPELFSTCGKIYVGKGTNPTSSSLKELVKAAGGQITEDAANAKIIIGLEGLKEIWVLDSITTNKIQPIEQYRRN